MWGWRCVPVACGCLDVGLCMAVTEVGATWLRLLHETLAPLSFAIFTGTAVTSCRERPCRGSSWWGRLQAGYQWQLTKFTGHVAYQPSYTRQGTVQCLEVISSESLHTMNTIQQIDQFKLRISERIHSDSNRLQHGMGYSIPDNWLPVASMPLKLQQIYY